MLLASGLAVAAERLPAIPSLPTAVTATKPPTQSRLRNFQDFAQEPGTLRLPSTVSLSTSYASSTTTAVGSVNTSTSASGIDLPTSVSDLRMRVPAPVQVRLHNKLLEGDRVGAAIVPRELVAMAPSEDALTTIKTRGYTVLREKMLAALDMRVIVLRPPITLSTIDALDNLRSIDPEGTYDFNHLYYESDSTGATEIIAAPAISSALPEPAAGTPVRIGLIDSGIDAAHQAFQSTTVSAWGCEGNRVPSAHGTAVASLMVGGAGAFRGVAPRAQLYAADVYCKTPTGGSATAILDALAWLAGEKVTVVNMSLVGPPNIMLERAVAAMIKRGHLIVAAVGNDGPTSPPLYPAAYPGVVAVTAVDNKLRVLPEACRGPHVLFAGPGSDMAAATPDNHYGLVRGTSYAAPIVAAMLARTLAAPNHPTSNEAIYALAQRAIDLGAPGRDPVYGFGLVGAQYRIGLAALN